MRTQEPWRQSPLGRDNTGSISAMGRLQGPLSTRFTSQDRARQNVTTAASLGCGTPPTAAYSGIGLGRLAGLHQDFEEYVTRARDWVSGEHLQLPWHGRDLNLKPLHAGSGCPSGSAVSGFLSQVLPNGAALLVAAEAWRFVSFCDDANIFDESSAC